MNGKVATICPCGWVPTQCLTRAPRLLVPVCFPCYQKVRSCGPQRLCLPPRFSLASGSCLHQGTLTAQGKLLQQDTFYVIELEAGMQSRTKERRVFLFEQIVIFSELLRKGSLTPGYMFKRSIKVRVPAGKQKGRAKFLELCPSDEALGR